MDLWTLPGQSDSLAVWASDRRKWLFSAVSGGFWPTPPPTMQTGVLQAWITALSPAIVMNETINPSGVMSNSSLSRGVYLPWVLQDSAGPGQVGLNPRPMHTHPICVITPPGGLQIMPQDKTRQHQRQDGQGVAPPTSWQPALCGFRIKSSYTQRTIQNCIH